MRTLFFVPLVLMCMVSFPSSGDEDKPVSFAEYNAWAEKNYDPLTGEMNCKITDQIIVAVEDGKPKRYSGAKDQPDTGDNLTFRYNASERDITFFLGNSLHEYLDKNLRPRKGRLGGVQFGSSSNFFTDHLHIKPDVLIFRSTNPLISETLQINRYYKSDWDGLFTSAFHSNDYKSTQTLTLNCRTVKDNIDAIVTRFSSYPGNPFSKTE